MNQYSHEAVRLVALLLASAIFVTVSVLVIKYTMSSERTHLPASSVQLNILDKPAAKGRGFIFFLALLPVEFAGLVLGDPRLKKVLFLRHVDYLRHPGEGVVFVVLTLKADTLEPPVCYVLDILLNG